MWIENVPNPKIIQFQRKLINCRHRPTWNVRKLEAEVLVTKKAFVYKIDLYWKEMSRHLTYAPDSILQEIMLHNTFGPIFFSMKKHKHKTLFQIQAIISRLL